MGCQLLAETQLLSPSQTFVHRPFQAIDLGVNSQFDSFCAGDSPASRLYILYDGP